MRNTRGPIPPIVPITTSVIKNPPTIIDGCTFCPSLAFLTFPASKIRCPLASLYFAIDCSGSTNNSGSRGGGCRGGTRFDPDTVTLGENEPPTTNSTKPIILALLEAVAHTLYNLATQFDCTGVHLVIVSFSSSIHVAYDKIIESSKEMFEVASNLDELVYKEYASTAMELVFDFFAKKECKGRTLLVLCSDGQPNDKVIATTRLDALVAQYKQSCTLFDFFVIGAGSIRESKGGETIMCTSRFGGTRGGLTNATIVTASSSECDCELLKFYTEKATGESYYAPACGKYDELIMAIHDFLTKITGSPSQSRWTVDFTDAGKGFIDVSPEMNTTMNNLVASGAEFAVYQDPKYGDYVVSVRNGEFYQIAVTKVVCSVKPTIEKNPKVDVCALVALGSYTTTFYDKYITMYSTRPLAGDITLVQFITAHCVAYVPALTDHGMCRIRKLAKRAI